MVHDSANGCIFDFCENKSDIKLGMIAGNICPQCKAILMSYGIDEKALYAIERMLTVVRAEAIGKPIIFDENAAFIVMRFSANDENANAYKYGVQLALEELNIKCVRADNELSSGQLLRNESSGGKYNCKWATICRRNENNGFIIGRNSSMYFICI